MIDTARKGALHPDNQWRLVEHPIRGLRYRRKEKRWLDGKIDRMGLSGPTMVAIGLPG